MSDSLCVSIAAFGRDMADKRQEGQFLQRPPTLRARAPRILRHPPSTCLSRQSRRCTRHPPPSSPSRPGWCRGCRSSPLSPSARRTPTQEIQNLLGLGGDSLTASQEPQYSLGGNDSRQTEAAKGAQTRIQSPGACRYWDSPGCRCS